MNVFTTGGNFGAITITVENSGARLDEYFVSSASELANRRALADELISASYDLATESGFIQDTYPWLDILADYMTSDMCEYLTKKASEIK